VGITFLKPVRRMDVFLATFDDVPDLRADNARHDLCELLVVGFVAVLCGATNCAGMAAFGREKQHVFIGLLKLRQAIPLHDIDPTVFRVIDKKALGAVFGRVLAGIAALPGPTRQRRRRCHRHRRQGAARRARPGPRWAGQSARTRMMVSADAARLAPDAGQGGRRQRRRTGGGARGAWPDRAQAQGRDRRCVLLFSHFHSHRYLMHQSIAFGFPGL